MQISREHSPDIDFPSLNMCENDGDDSKPLVHGCRHDSSSAENTYKYEEFSQRLKVQCPTCQGKGKLTQSQADSMVALIPVRDKRLRPRKTKLYLAITVVICVICIFLIAFFLLPRSVSVTIINTQSINIYMPDNTHDVPYIDVKITYLVNNQNFFEANVKGLSPDVSWNRYILNTSSNIEDFVVAGRSKKNHTLISRQIFSDPDVCRKVKIVCASGWNWLLLEKFVSVANIYYLTRNEEISSTYYGYTQCHNTSSFEWLDNWIDT